MKARNLRWFVLFFVVGSLWSGGAGAAQRNLLKLTIGYTPISGAALPFFIAVEEKLFQKYGLEIAPVFMGGSPLINSAILAGEFPIGYTAGGAIISSRRELRRRDWRSRWKSRPMPMAVSPVTISQ